MHVRLTEARDGRFLYATEPEHTNMGWRYRDWQVSPSQDCQGWWNVMSRLIESNEEGYFLGILDMEDPVEFRSHADAVEWVFRDANLVGRLHL